MDKRLHAYACLYHGLKEDDVQESKQFKYFAKIVGPYISDSSAIYMDAIANKGSRRRKLEAAVSDLQMDIHTLLQHPRGVIVIPSIVDLGRNSKEIIKNYKYVASSDIGLFFINTPEFNTVKNSMDYYEDLIDRLKSFEGTFSSIDIKSFSSTFPTGRRKNTEETL